MAQEAFINKPIDLANAFDAIYRLTDLDDGLRQVHEGLGVFSRWWHTGRVERLTEQVIEVVDALGALGIDSPTQLDAVIATRSVPVFPSDVAARKAEIDGAIEQTRLIYHQLHMQLVSVGAWGEKPRPDWFLAGDDTPARRGRSSRREAFKPVHTAG